MEERFLRVQAHLTDRDHVLLGWLADHGVLTSFQIAHALYGSLDFAQRRLRKLCQVDLPARLRPFRAEGGTYPYHYVLGQLGTEVVAAHRGEMDDHGPAQCVPQPGPEPGQRRRGAVQHGTDPAGRDRAAQQRIISPYDTDARYSEKRGTSWEGYKVHITETCDNAPTDDGTTDP